MMIALDKRLATTVIAGVFAFMADLPAAPAQAQAARTFVSAAGSDNNSCANVALPCRHFAAAYTATAPNGEIYVLDPANYGSLTITGPVSIEGHGWASIAAASFSAAITINAKPGDKINIIGVVLDGTGAFPTDGIKFNSGGSLTVRDCVIRNLSNDGISFFPISVTPSQLFVSNTLISDNGSEGIFIYPDGSATTTGVLDHVEIENNADHGLFVITGTQNINMTVNDSISANNGASGVIASSTGGTPVNIMVRNSTITNNVSDGLLAYGTGGTIRVTRSTITGNGAGWSTDSGGTVTSYGDNNIDGNGSANSEPPGALVYH
jgi:hypothetical protein